MDEPNTPKELTPEEKDSQLEALKEQVVNLETENTQLTTDKTATVGELKEKREELREAKEKIVTLETSPVETPPVEGANVEEAVNSVLAKRDLEVAGKNKDAALEAFTANHKEFHTDNDPTGLKREAFEKKLARFNMEGLQTVTEFTEVMNDTLRLLGTNDTPPATTVITPPSAPQSQQEPDNIVITDISLREKEVIERMGWTEEKFLEMKMKDPDFIAQIFKDQR